MATRNIAPAVLPSDLTFETAVDLSSLIYTFVNVASGLITGGTTNAFVAGILQDYPVPADTSYANANSNATVRPSGPSLITLGYTGSVGDKVKCGTGGTAQLAGSGQDYHAILLSSGVSGDRVLCVMAHGTA